MNNDSIEHEVREFCVVHKATIETTREFDDRVLCDALEAQKKMETPMARTEPNIWRTFMKNRMTKLAAAAAIVVAVFLGAHFVGGPDMSGVAFANVVRPLLAARTATFTLTRRAEDQPPLSYDMMYKEPLLSRSLMPGGLILVGDMNQGKIVTLLPSKKKATISIVPPEARNKGGLLDIRRLIREAQQHEQESVEFLGKQQVDGHPAIGFRIQYMTIWADSVTLLPIRIECILPSLAGREHEIVEMTDFVFDIELKESLFSLEVPEGYTVVTNFNASDFEGDGK
jgi:outer membrane lipoprotein-sorting protein